MTTLLEQAKCLVKEKLRDHPNRLAHSFGVAQTARKLALIHHVNPDAAELAGLFHDYAKYDPISEQIASIDPVVVEKFKNHPVIYHAYAAAHDITKLLGVEDEAVLSAIMHHVWGKPNMTTLEKILFVSDYCEPTRPFSDRAYIDDLAHNDLNEAVRYCMKSSIDDLEKRGLKPSPESIEAYHYYSEVKSGITK